MARRQFGSIRKLQSGRFQARYYGPDGQRYTSPVTYPTKTAAGIYLDSVHTDIVRSTWRAPHRGRLTLAEYGRQWIEQRKLKRTTRANYASLFRLHIEPQIGGVLLRELTPDRVRTWNHELGERLAKEQDAKRAAAAEHGRDFSVATVRDGQVTAAHAYRLLRTIMNTAVEDDLVQRNPCRIKEAGVIRSAERPTASVAEVMRLVDLVPERYELLILIGAFVGPRYGEEAALRRSDIRITRRVSKKGRVKFSGRIEFSERVYVIDGTLDYDAPKSKAGVRSVPMPAAIIPWAVTHLEKFVGPEPDALVFTTSGGKSIGGGNGFASVWRRVRKEIGRPDLRWHDLRHTGQTLAALAGATEAELMRRMGHGTRQAASHYLHTTEEHGEAVADELSRQIIGNIAQSPKVLPLRPVQRRGRRSAG